MGRLSKQERKQLRRQAEESIRQTDSFFHVVSPKATLSTTPIERIIEEARKVGVNLTHRPLGGDSYVVAFPGASEGLCVVIGYGQVDEALLAIAADYEWLHDTRGQVPLGTPVISYRAKMELDPVISFIGVTMERVLGRLVGGALIDGGIRVVHGDWMTWSGDFLAKDMFSFRQEFSELLRRFPSLRWSEGQSVRKPWWRIW